MIWKLFSFANMYISLQCLTMEGFPSESIKNSILRMFGQLFAEWEEAKATMFMPSPKKSGFYRKRNHVRASWECNKKRCISHHLKCSPPLCWCFVSTVFVHWIGYFSRLSTKLLPKAEKASIFAKDHINNMMVGVEFLYAHPKLLLHCCIKKYDGQRGQEKRGQTLTAGKPPLSYKKFCWK